MYLQSIEVVISLFVSTILFLVYIYKSKVFHNLYKLQIETIPFVNFYFVIILLSYMIFKVTHNIVYLVLTGYSLHNYLFVFFLDSIVTVRSYFFPTVSLQIYILFLLQDLSIHSRTMKVQLNFSYLQLIVFLFYDKLRFLVQNIVVLIIIVLFIQLYYKQIVSKRLSIQIIILTISYYLLYIYTTLNQLSISPLIFSIVIFIENILSCLNVNVLYKLNIEIGEQIVNEKL